MGTKPNADGNSAVPPMSLQSERLIPAPRTADRQSEGKQGGGVSPRAVPNGPCGSPKGSKTLLAPVTGFLFRSRSSTIPTTPRRRGTLKMRSGLSFLEPLQDRSTPHRALGPREPSRVVLPGQAPDSLDVTLGKDRVRGGFPAWQTRPCIETMISGEGPSSYG